MHHINRIMIHVASGIWLKTVQIRFMLPQRHGLILLIFQIALMVSWADTLANWVVRPIQ